MPCLSAEIVISLCLSTFSIEQAVCLSSLKSNISITAAVDNTDHNPIATTRALWNFFKKNSVPLHDITDRVIH